MNDPRKSDVDTVNGISYRKLEPHETLAYTKSETRGFGSVYRIQQGNLERNAEYYKSAQPTCAVDGNEIVGTIAASNLEVGVPGAVVPMAGVTNVTVAPTHRRRGILTEMMRRQLHQVHQRGFSLAGLWASESAIYGRFGYGMAVEQQEISIEKHRAMFNGIGLELVQETKSAFATADEVRHVGPKLWREKMQTTPGMVSRNHLDWERSYPNRADPNDSLNTFHVLSRDGDNVTGFVSYHVSDSSDPDGLDYKKLTVRELVAPRPDAEAALWRFVLDVDLVHEVAHGGHPVRSNLWHLLNDPRCMRQVPYDGLWLRILDVPRVLSERTYDICGSVTMEVTDDFGGWVQGKYALDVTDNGSAECKPTDQQPDIIMPIETLGAIYLGAHGLSTLAAAGRCSELTQGAVHKVDAMFATNHVHQVTAEF